MELISIGIVGLALYLLYRYRFAGGAGVVGTNAGDNTPYPSGDNGGGTPPDPTGPPGPSGPPSPTGPVWTALDPSAQATPGATYRASAPPQDVFTMMMIPSTLASRGFINVQIYKPGDAFPDDWPDTGTKLRIQADLPAGAAPQSLSDLGAGVTVWRLTPAQATGLAAAAVEQAMRGAPVAPFGVYAGLVRRRGL